MGQPSHCDVPQVEIPGAGIAALCMTSRAFGFMDKGAGLRARTHLLKVSNPRV